MPPKHKEIDKALAKWRQGDVVLGEQSFVYVADPNQALTPESERAKNTGHFQTIDKKVDGLVVVTQSCDIVRDCKNRPFIEVAPLVKVKEEDLERIKNCRRPRYVFIPATAGYFLVGDLDQIMTVEKSVVVSWERTQGCETSDEARKLAKALARKRDRFAFPNDFSELIERLAERIKDKHSKNSDEGKFLQALREIRVRAEPDWEADQVNLCFWFILEGEAPSDFESQWGDKFHDQYLGMITPMGRFKPADAKIMFLEDLTARDYVESDQLDLDHLSESEKRH